jgi:hypothetical protein
MSSTTRICSFPRPSRRKPGEGAKIPLLFLCSAEKFRCSADLIPLLGRVAELMRKPLIYKAVYGRTTGIYFAPIRGFFCIFRCKQGNRGAAPARR